MVGSCSTDCASQVLAERVVCLSMVERVFLCSAAASHSLLIEGGHADSISIME